MEFDFFDTLRLAADESCEFILKLCSSFLMRSSSTSDEACEFQFVRGVRLMLMCQQFVGYEYYQREFLHSVPCRW